MKTTAKRKRERGQALVLTALSMVCLIGFLGLAIDIGLLFRHKVDLQKVADAAAIAGAAQLLTGASGNYTDAAKASAAQNGIPLDESNGTVTVSLGTTYHPDAVKVYVSQVEPRRHARGKYVTAIDTVVLQASPQYQNSSVFVGLPADVD